MHIHYCYIVAIAEGIHCRGNIRTNYYAIKIGLDKGKVSLRGWKEPDRVPIWGYQFLCQLDIFCQLLWRLCSLCTRNESNGLVEEVHCVLIPKICNACTHCQKCKHPCKHHLLARGSCGSPFSTSARAACRSSYTCRSSISGVPTCGYSRRIVPAFGLLFLPERRVHNAKICNINEANCWDCYQRSVQRISCKY